VRCSRHSPQRVRGPVAVALAAAEVTAAEVTVADSDGLVTTQWADSQNAAALETSVAPSVLETRSVVEVAVSMAAVDDIRA
jgi:hypothetical protein